MTARWPWLALVGLGAFHGLNPAMGWLFAVALGLQRGGRAVVLGSMLPIALGHALSIALVVAAFALLRALIDAHWLALGAAAALITFGLYRLVARHRGRAGMQVGGAQLVLWSFLMATAHGAGLMLVPVLFGLPLVAAAEDTRSPLLAHAGHLAHLGLFDGTTTALLAVAVHTLAMLCTAAIVALVVYDWVGLAFLRRGWINLDFLWAGALIAAGVLMLAIG